MSNWNGFRLVQGAIEDDTIAPEPAKDVEKTSEDKGLQNKLQELLANVSLFYHTVHEFHWNIKGSDFYQYHKFYDEIVSDVYDSIDPIAENIRKLGGQTKYKMSELLKIATIKEVDGEKTDTRTLTSDLVSLNSSIIDFLNETFSVANKENQQGIANFIAERIDMHQKWNWFLKSSIEE